MFGYRKQILELKREIMKLSWKIENPPKYKVGDVMDNGSIVTNVQLKATYFSCFDPDFWYKYETVTPNKNG